MNLEIPTNKLSVYLIKEAYSDHHDILRQFEKLHQQQIGDIGTLYFGASHTLEPSWKKKFFVNELDEGEIFSASAKAIFLIRVEVAPGNNRLFAIPFGYGWTLLNPGVYEERFGLKTAFNVIDPNNLRRLDKKNLASVPKDTSEQLSRAGVAADFGIDIEQDLIRSVTAKIREDRVNMYGNLITGKDAVSVSARVDVSNIQGFLKRCYEDSQADTYKKDFGFIDQMSEIKDIGVINDLNDKLIESIRNNQTEKTWMAVPELVEWAELAGFAYRNKKEELKEDICLSDFLNALPEDQRNDITLDVFRKKAIFGFSATSDEVRYRWKAWDCLYCEISDQQENQTCILSNGKWYEIEADFATEVNADYQKLRDTQATIELPLYQHDNENDYNESVAEENHEFCCMDSKNIMYGGGYSRIEFCDLLSRGKKIVHVKHYGGSSVLSHLFAQGLVSGELFLADKEFRNKVNGKLPDGHKIEDPDSKPNPMDYTVVFAIISSSPGDLEIPFFSKVGLRNARRRLETFGYKVFLQKVGVDS